MGSGFFRGRRNENERTRTHDTMSAAYPHGELWFTRHQAERDPALAARLRQAVSRDVASACVDARTTAEYTVDAGRTISKHRVEVRRGPLAPLCIGAPQLILGFVAHRISRTRGCRHSQRGRARTLARRRC